ncbi:MAG: transcriptional regulator [Candidatus Altiarchaeales archaeon ex4484_2]|nr:MAG: transcriptional regulator [Candidatus Altiarchaeales archaeon ex4484_2]
MEKHTLCGEEGDYCPIYNIKCGSDIEKCPVYRAFKSIGKKWTLQIPQEFFVNQGIRRFNQIQNSLHWITPKVISTRLKDMENEDIIERKVYPDNTPVRVEYTLKDKGQDLQEIIQKASEGGKKWEIES